MQGARKWTAPFLVAIEALLKHVAQGDVERHLQKCQLSQCSPYIGASGLLLGEHNVFSSNWVTSLFAYLYHLCHIIHVCVAVAMAIIQDLLPKHFRALKTCMAMVFCIHWVCNDSILSELCTFAHFEE
jgi:hypothetical protein